MQLFRRRPPPEMTPREEAAYHEFRIGQIESFERLAAVAGAASVLAFTWWDIQFYDVALTDTVFIRSGLALMLLALLAITSTAMGRRHGVTQFAATALLIGGFAWVLTRLPDGFNVGIGGLVLGIALLPMLAYRLVALLRLCALAIVIPNLFLATTEAARFTYININVWLLLAAMLAVAFWWVLDDINRRLFLTEQNLEYERARADDLLANMLPADIANRLKTSPETIAERFDSVTVMFADIVGFTAFARDHEASLVVKLLNALFSRFDDLVAELGLEKIKTLGDGYMAASGVPVPRPDHAQAVAEVAMRMMAATDEFCRERNVSWRLRIGIHSGEVVAGVIGKRRYAYDLWGDAVNVASRIESTAAPGRIQLTEPTVRLLESDYVCEARGTVELKNRGPVQTYYLVGRRERRAPATPGLAPRSESDA